jgi:hypothetical protein
MSARASLFTALALTASVSIQMGGCLSSGNPDAGTPDSDKPVQQPPASETPKPTEPTPPKDPDAKRDTAQENVTVTGILRGGIMGIGAEHTGWQIEREGGLSPIELGIGKIGRETAQKFEGKKVTITGKMIDRKYVERGVVKILRADTIADAKNTRY